MTPKLPAPRPDPAPVDPILASVAAIVWSRRLRPTELSILSHFVAVAMHVTVSEFEGGYTGIMELVVQTDTSESTVRHALAVLDNHGLVETASGVTGRRGKRPTVYRLNRENLVSCLFLYPSLRQHAHIGSALRDYLPA